LYQQALLGGFDLQGQVHCWGNQNTACLLQLQSSSQPAPSRYNATQESLESSVCNNQLLLMIGTVQAGQNSQLARMAPTKPTKVWTPEEL
jgi:hypothetical protein